MNSLMISTPKASNSSTRCILVLLKKSQSAVAPLREPIAFALTKALCTAQVGAVIIVDTRETLDQRALAAG
jgi:hypothetical protein